MKFFASLSIPVLALLVLLAFGMPATAQAGCKHSSDPVRSISKKNARAAIGCLFNKGRSADNVKKNGDLQQAAQNHSSVMASRRCMSHQCPGEANLLVRVSRTGYLRGSNSYELGEVVLASSAKDNAREIVNKWFNSPPHKTTITRSSFDHVGVGLSIRDGVVWATGDFGRH